MKIKILILSLLLPIVAGAQFAPQALVGGSTAVPKNSPQFSAWANRCTIIRGLQKISDPSLGLASVGDSSAAIGMADGSVVSLGDSGVATMRFAKPIRNEAGADFAIFENGFAKIGDAELAFLELAFVEVSSDGVNFTRFPATSQTPDTEQISSIGGMSYISARRLNNLAGKYIGGWGTPFDLAELSGTPGLDIDAITHVRIIDVIGDVGTHASRDAGGNIINDPFPTDFASGGFDLDAVGVLNAPSADIGSYGNETVRCFPNPAADVLHIDFPAASGFDRAAILDLSGRVIKETHLSGNQSRMRLNDLSPACYYLRLTAADGTQCTKAFVHQ